MTSAIIALSVTVVILVVVLLNQGRTHRDHIDAINKNWRNHQDMVNRAHNETMDNMNTYHMQEREQLLNRLMVFTDPERAVTHVGLSEEAGITVDYVGNEKEGRGGWANGKEEVSDE